jgi:hypothetical protein
MKSLVLSIFAAVLFLGFACQQVSQTPLINPPAPGFNSAESDEVAVQIADKMMEAMGGRKNWDDTRCISWNFFGRRHLVWNKSTGDVRIDIPADSTTFLLNIQTIQGKAKIGSNEISHPDSLSKYLERGKRIWINDAYWLFMPFKLKDDGVTLKYVSEDTLPGALPADLLSLTFENVGVTPQNKYHVWVDKSDHLIKQWGFYRNRDQEEPPRIWPWDNYQKYGEILLSGDRSDQSGPRQIQVFDELAESVFTSFEKPDFIRL